MTVSPQLLSVRIHLNDLSLKTLVGIKLDLQRYAHLAAYVSTYETVCRELTFRQKIEGTVTGRVTGEKEN